jgi:uncharacterized protein (DUF885 family)
MNRFSHWVSVGICAALLAACDARPPPAPLPRAADAGSQSERLQHIVERYWDDRTALAPGMAAYGETQFGATPGSIIAPQSLADALALERRYLAEVSALPMSTLDANARLTYDIFRRDRLLAIEGYTYPFELLPVNPYDGVPQQFALAASAAERAALSSPAGFDEWRARSADFAQWTAQAIANMRDGMRRGYTLPRPLVQESLAQFAALAEDNDANPFNRAAQTDAAGGGAEARSSDAMRTTIRVQILPSYRLLHDFLQHEYLPRSRTSIALSALPLGEGWYAYLARRVTESGAAPAQLHALGLAEVDRLHRRVQSLLAEGSFPGNAQSFIEHMRQDPRYSYKTGADLTHAYEELEARVASAAPALFSVFPQADFAIQTVAAYRAAVTPPLSYRPRPLEGSSAAILDVNTALLDTKPAIDVTAQFLREAIPGHHYQIELQRERTDLPKFRRLGTAPAFVEGWGLYAATLGEELGLDATIEGRFAALRAQLACAVGLVVDTGLHAQAWTRQQAQDYVRAQVPTDDDDAVRTVDRMLALPGEALACTVGYLKIQGLRTLAQQTLGARFDLRGFHAEVIADGAIPLDLLEAKLKAWLVTSAAAAGPTGADSSAPAGAQVGARTVD